MDRIDKMITIQMRLVEITHLLEIVKPPQDEQCKLICEEAGLYRELYVLGPWD